MEVLNPIIELFLSSSFFPLFSFCCFVLSIFSLTGITQLCHCNIELTEKNTLICDMWE